MAAGDAAALDAVLLLNLGIELLMEGFDSAAGSRLGIFASVVGSTGPWYDLKPPMLRDCAWLGAAEWLEGLTRVLAEPAPFEAWLC